MTRSRQLVLGLVGLSAIAVAAAILLVPELRWRTQLVALSVTGEVDGISLGELLPMLAPGSGFYLENMVATRNPYSTIQNPLAGADALERGAELYGSGCVTCHGADGVGSAGPSLQAGNLRSGDADWAIFRVIRDGVPGTAMPPHDLPDRDLWSLVARIRAWQSAVAAPVAAAKPLTVNPVTAARLLDAAAEPHNWLTYSGTYSGIRHSALDQVNRANAGQLSIRWVHQFEGSGRVVETTPLVNDGVMYVTEPPSTVHALDAATGETLWTYTYTNAADVAVCCGLLNRGVAVAGDTVYLATVDVHLVALDAATGQQRWKVRVEDYRATAASMTGAPLVVGDKVIVGVGGGDMGARGFIDARSAEDGRPLWRFYTIPGPGDAGHDTWSGDSWRHGGGGTWLTGTFDPRLNLLYWAVGNPGPDYQGELRQGDNLYTASVVALDADTGKLRWHFQFTPHDERDWAANQMPALVDLSWQGRVRPLMLWANRNGFYYVLDRATGEFLLGRPFARQNWAEGLDPAGRPIEIAGARPDMKGKATWPTPLGAMSWQSTSYSPRTNLFYLPALEWGQLIYKDAKPAEYVFGKSFLGGGHRSIPGNENLYFAIRALDPVTGDLRWEYRRPERDNWWKTGGLVSTAGDIVFGGENREFFVLDAVDGSELWRRHVGGRINASPITYAVDGRQYFALAAGRSIISVGLP